MAIHGGISRQEDYYARLPVFGQNAPNGMNFYSLDREAQPGRETAARLSRMLPMVSGAKLDAYIATLATSLQRDGDTRFSYSFAVYEDRKPAVVDRVPLVQPVDAFHGPAREPIAVAGGPVFVPLGLLAGAESEAEFAFVLSHAIAHISLRHSHATSDASGAFRNGRRGAAERAHSGGHALRVRSSPAIAGDRNGACRGSGGRRGCRRCDGSGRLRPASGCPLSATPRGLRP